MIREGSGREGDAEGVRERGSERGKGAGEGKKGMIEEGKERGRGRIGRERGGQVKKTGGRERGRRT